MSNTDHHIYTTSLPNCPGEVGVSIKLSLGSINTSATKTWPNICFWETKRSFLRTIPYFVPTNLKPLNILTLMKTWRTHQKKNYIVWKANVDNCESSCMERNEQSKRKKVQVVKNNISLQSRAKLNTLQQLAVISREIRTPSDPAYRSSVLHVKEAALWLGWHDVKWLIGTAAVTTYF